MEEVQLQPFFSTKVSQRRSTDRFYPSTLDGENVLVDVNSISARRLLQRSNFTRLDGLKLQLSSSSVV